MDIPVMPTNTPVIPVLLYHSVGDQPPANGSWGAVSRSEFAAHVEAIGACGREGITVTMLAAALRGEQQLPERPVAITFDDGYEDTYAAVELLHSRGLCSTVYVTTGEIGTPDRLSRRQICTMASELGVELGAHAVHHVHLDELPPGQLAEELAASKTQLEELTGGTVESFAYPHGAYDGHVRDAVIDAGYRSAAAVKNAVSHLADDPFAIARWTVMAATPAERIAEVLAGEGVPLSWTRERLRTRVYRSARRHRGRFQRSRRAAC
jgi:peptidoglycan/xylan/chitin deacetylase (PgdA/CDA1 family)